MKRLILGMLALACVLPMTAQDAAKDEKENEGFVFTTVKENPITSVKNQNRSGTCWCFSGLGFFESELLREGKGEYDLAEMFIVHHTMTDRAENYMRLHGYSSFLAGGSFFDVLQGIRDYGIVPQSAYPGIMYGDTLPVHNELDATAQAYVEALATSHSKKLTPVWKKGLSAIYDTYLGELPTTFEYEGKEYTPESFRDHLGLNLDDYISITSFTHHPFYTTFPILVPDNWRLSDSYNVPMNEMMEIMEQAIMEGYTFAWGADVSETGFTRNGIAVMPDAAHGAELTGSDMAKWLGMDKKDRQKELTEKPLPEIKVTQEMRQQAYDNWETQDDHGMLIYGIAKDQNGKKYFMMKNSWGTTSQYKGIWYVSEAFMQYKTMNILINKKAVPRKIAKKMHIK